MRGLVVYESMFGNTRKVAEAVANSLDKFMEVRLIRADIVAREDLHNVDLLVVGAPTHAWGMPRPNTRRGAMNNLSRPGSDLVIEPRADTSAGVREWLDSIGYVHCLAAVFDTRFRAPATLTGRATKGIVRSLGRHDVEFMTSPESFFVSRKNHLMAGEYERATAWGQRLGELVVERTQVHHLTMADQPPTASSHPRP